MRHRVSCNFKQGGHLIEEVTFDPTLEESEEENHADN